MCILFFQSNFYNKENPSITSRLTSFTNWPNISLTEENFGFSFALTKIKGIGNIPIDPTIFTVRVEKVDKYSIEKPKSEVIKFKTCSEQNFIINNQRNDTSNDLTVTDEIKYCLNKNDFEVGGSQKYPFSNYLVLTLQKCNGTNSNVICKSPQVIDDTLANIMINVHCMDHNIDHNNYHNPIYGLPQTAYLMIDPKASKFMDITLKTLELFTNDYFFFFWSQTKDLKSFITQKNLIDSSSIYPGYAEIRIRSDPLAQQDIRVYEGFSQVLANIWASASVLMILGNLVVHFTGKLDIMKKIFNKMFFFRLNKKKDQNIPTNSEVVIKKQESINRILSF